MTRRVLISTTACALAAAGLMAAASSGKGFGGPWRPGARMPGPGVELATAGTTVVSDGPAVPVGAGGLAAAVRKAGQGGAEWIAYQVPMVAGQSFTCCWDRSWQQGTCFLEKSNQGWGGRGDDKPARQDLAVLLRVENGKVGKLRGVSAGCPIDPGGKRLTWLSGVSEEESLALLGALVEGKDDVRSQGDEAFAVIAFHAAPRADALLAEFARSGAPKRRSEALFWIAQRGAPGAAETILAAIDRETSSEVREQGVFALSQLPDEAGTRSLLGLLQGNRSADLRRQALFWLAQSDDPRAFDALAEILER